MLKQDNIKPVCIFTGASGTLGSAFCERYYRDFNIIAVSRSGRSSAPTQFQSYIDPLNPEKTEEHKHSVFSIRANLLDDRDCERIIEVSLAKFGRIDHLINAAAQGTWAPMVQFDANVNNALNQINLNTVVPLKLSNLVARAFWRERKEENISNNRSILNISSTAGAKVYPYSGQSVYSASKAALNFLSIHMAFEFKLFGIRVNALAPNSFPGIVKTEAVADCIAEFIRNNVSSTVLTQDQNGFEDWKIEVDTSYLKFTED